MKNSADQGGCYPQRPKAEVDNTLRDLQNFSYPTKAEFNNCFIIHSKYFPVLKGVSSFRSPKITQSRPQVFSVNGSIICSGLHFWRHWFNMAKILSKIGEQQLVMVNYACGFNQSEMVIYFEWIINIIIICLAPWARKMNRILRCDWLPERARWRYLARSGLPAACIP